MFLEARTANCCGSTFVLKADGHPEIGVRLASRLRRAAWNQATHCPTADSEPWGITHAERQLSPRIRRSYDNPTGSHSSTTS